MSQSPEAYERLIIDAMRGDATLFTRNDEVDAQWSIIDPILEAWHEADDRPLPTYEAGTAGPAEADDADRPARQRVARSCERGRLERARHDAERDRGGAARAARPALPGGPRVRPRARDEPRRDRRPRLPRRGREPARARRPLPPVAARHRRGRGGPHPARRVGDGRGRGRGAPARATSPSGASASRSTSARSTSSSLDTIVDPLLVPDLATMVWAPHGHHEGVDALRRLANIVLVDTQDEPDGGRGVRARRRPDALGLRGRPRVAALDAVARARRGDLRPARDARARSARSSKVVVRHRDDSTAAGVLFCGWLASRLGWRPEALARRGDAAHRPLPRAPRRGDARAACPRRWARPAWAA